MLSISLIVSNVQTLLFSTGKGLLLDSDSDRDMNIAKSQSFTECFASKTDSVWGNSAAHQSL